MSNDGKNSTRRLLHGQPRRADEQVGSRKGLSVSSGLDYQSYCVTIETVLSMLREVGYHQLTTEEVATVTGVDAATIRRWWPTKASLVIEAISHRMRQAPSMCGDPEKDTRAMVSNLVEIFNDTVPCALPALVGDGVNDSRGAQRLATVLETYRSSNAASLLSAVSYDEPPDDIGVIDILDVIAGTILYRRLIHRPVDDALIEQLTKLALAGQLPRLNPALRS
jgi:AcrR family transcriptional regulator